MTDSRSQHHVILLPVETAARELDAKLLLAVVAAAKGMTVFLGRRPELNMRLHAFPRGIYMAHNFDRKRRRILSIARKLGYAIVAWDEEGLVWHSPQAYCRRRVAPDTVQLLDAIIAWGKGQEEALRECGTGNVPIQVLGNPRADLYRPELVRIHEEQVRQIRGQYGRFLLVNSIFGWLNHYIHYDPGTAYGEAYMAKIAGISGHAPEYLHSQKEALLITKVAIRHLVRDFPEMKIIVRPHPSETREAWRDMEELENVHIIKDSRLIPWLAAAHLMIHAGCTTAVEYALMGRCSVLYTGEAKSHVAPQTKAVSRVAENYEALAAFVRQPPVPDEKIHTALAHMVASYDAERTASEAIVDFLAGITPTRPAASLSGLMVHGLRNLQHRLTKRLSSYQRQKFEDLAPRILYERITALAMAMELPIPNMKRIAEEGNLVRIDGDAEGV